MITKFYYHDVTKAEREGVYNLYIGITFENQPVDLLSPSVFVEFESSDVLEMMLCDEGLVTLNYDLSNEEENQIREYIAQNVEAINERIQTLN